MNEKKYASYADFERDQYLRVMSFYENLEDIMDDNFFDTDNDKGKKNRVYDEAPVDDLDF